MWWQDEGQAERILNRVATMGKENDLASLIMLFGIILAVALIIWLLLQFRKPAKNNNDEDDSTDVLAKTVVLVVQETSKTIQDITNAVIQLKEAFDNSQREQTKINESRTTELMKVATILDNVMLELSRHNTETEASNNTLGIINSTLAGQVETINGMNEKIDSPDGPLQQILKKIDGLDSQLSELISEVRQYRVDVKHVEDKGAALESNVSDVQTQIELIKSDVQKLTSENKTITNESESKESNNDGNL